MPSLDPENKKQNLPWSKKVLWLAVLWATYFATAKLGFIFAIIHSNVTALWAPCGISFVAFFLLGRWVWPAVFIGAFAANLSTGVPLFASVCIGVGNTLAPFVGTSLLQRVKDFRSDFSRIKDVFWFLALGVGLAPISSATIGVASLWQTGAVASEKVLDSWLTWWSGDALGVLVIVPLVFVMRSLKWSRPPVKSLVEAAVLVSTFVWIAVFVIPQNELLKFLVFPFLIFAAIRFAHFGVVSLIFILGFVSFPIILLNIKLHPNPLDPFAVFRLQIFIAMSGLPGLLLAAAVTERKRALDSLRDNEKLLSSVLQTLPVAVFGKDIKKDFQWNIWNKQAEETFGLTSKECLGNYDRNLFPKEQADFFRAKDLEASRTHGIIDMPEETIQTAKGLLTMRSRITVIRDQAGAPWILLGIAEDISERARFADSLKTSQHSLSEAQRLTGVGSWEQDLSCNRLTWSDQMYRIFGVDPGTFPATYESFLDTVHPDDRAKVDRAYTASLTEGVPYDIEYRIIHKMDGQIRWGHAICEHIRDKTGKVLRSIGTVQDITERKLLDEKLNRMKEIAEDANRTKDEFIATLSHELRTPLTSILTWAQILRMNGLDSEKTKYGIDALERSALAQGQLIDDLLDISRIQAGKLKLEIHDTQLEQVIRGAVDSTRSFAAIKKLNIETNVGPHLENIQIDPLRVQQIVWNLLTNAIKFSANDGKIEITADLLSAPTGQGVRIVVRDYGKGIQPEFLPVIFDRFTQADSTTTRAYSGLGLGLAIVKNLVELHRGTVVAESQGEGKGATFSVWLPLIASPEVSPNKMLPIEDENAEAEVSLRGFRLLLVEDEIASREAFSAILESLGAEVLAAESAAEGFRFFQEFKPDVLVSDIGMPIEDGYSLIKKIRALKSDIRKTPALALTAYAGREDIKRVLLAGFQAHMAKPTDAFRLAREIQRLAKKDKSNSESVSLLGNF